MRRIRTSAVLLAVFLSARLVSAQCPGDCNGDQRVSVGELVRAVNISFGEAPLDDCPGLDVGGDGEVRVGDLVRAVNNALNGCPATPTPTFAPTPTIDFPDVSGVWDERPLRTVTSTCLELFSAAFAAELAGRQPCPHQVASLQDRATIVDCNQTVSIADLDGQGVLTFDLPVEQGSADGCTVTLHTSVRVPAGVSPTVASYAFDIEFAGSCPLDSCRVTAVAPWTFLTTDG